ncbi:uncharacterized protein LOC108907923 isoform X2 [Anoplophora glabripennis]|uniref:uncharacterized protein LOC108907923 isoform X2 n=1 Tax=Anoplophora glabripennis TaxID=217634 RepID=UPI000873E0D4|nr:uncharacterized protein LOC108907923 isoform X2 [Anoplophora glabripennis]
MRGYCVNLCIVVLISLYIRNANGQTEIISNTTRPANNTKPVIKTNVHETEGFNSSNVKSGPVLIIDKKNIFISNLNYISKDNDTYFWAGVGEPSSNGLLVPDENNTTSPLRTYEGQNIYLQLPDRWTYDKIDYVAVWSVEAKTDLGHILLYKNNSEARNNVPEALGYHKMTKDNKPIYRIPTCCGLNEIYLSETKTCTSVDTDLTIDLAVFDSNETHIDPERLLDNVEFAPYRYFAQCGKNSVGVIVEKEEVLGFIYNSSLLYYFTPDDYGTLHHGSFCILYRNVTEHKVVVCTDLPVTEGASISYLYLPFLIISTICFFSSAVIYIVILKARDIHRKCFVGYSISMTVTFISLICLQKMSGACNFTGGLFMFSMICSFVWLACLCIDLIYVVKSTGRRAQDDTRIYVYMAVSLLVPVVVLTVSLIPDGIPDIPLSFVKSYSGADTCNFGEVKIGVFFIPIGLLILASVVGLCYTSYIINTHDDRKDYEWLHNKSRFKFMLIQCILICIIMTLSFVAWLVLNLLQVDEKDGFLLSLVLIQYMQGILVVLIIFGHNYSSKVIEKRKCKNSLNQQNGNEMKPLHQGKDLFQE